MFFKKRPQNVPTPDTIELINLMYNSLVARIELFKETEVNRETNNSTKTHDHLHAKLGGYSKKEAEKIAELCDGFVNGAKDYQIFQEQVKNIEQQQKFLKQLFSL